jgi:hypothetical protein
MRMLVIFLSAVGLRTASRAAVIAIIAALYAFSHLSPSRNGRSPDRATLLGQVCNTAAASASCQQYKALVHPDFPAYAPLVRAGSQPQLR